MGVPQPLRSARRVDTLLLALIYCFCLVSTIPSPLSARETNSAPPSLLLPANVSALSAPVPPPEFGTDFHYDTTKVLSPLGVYLCAIDCMYKFAQAGWDNNFSGGVTVWVDSFDVQIDIEDASGDHGSLQLKTSHIILALYATIVDVATKSRFVEELTTISLHGRQIGNLAIEKKPPRTSDGRTDAANLTIPQTPLQSTAVTYPSGQYDDPDDPEFSVSYTYSGARINSNGIFLAVLDALATSAQVSPEMGFESLHAASPSGDCVIRVAKVDGPIKVDYSFVTTTLRILIRKIIVPLNKFEEIQIRLKWEAAVVAEASIQLADHEHAAQ